MFFIYALSLTLENAEVGGDVARMGEIRNGVTFSPENLKGT
jgi:hypothetical protein